MTYMEAWKLMAPQLRPETDEHRCLDRGDGMGRIQDSQVYFYRKSIKAQDYI